MNTLSLTVPASLAAKGVNATPFVVKQLKELAENGGTLCFEPGTYHFYEDGALSGFFAPSNNLSGTKKVCFPLLDAQNITVDGGDKVELADDGAQSWWEKIGSAVTNFFAQLAYLFN